MISQELMGEVIYVSLKNEYISKELIKKIVLDIISNCDSITQKEFNGIYFRKLNWDFTIAEVDEKNRIITNYSKMIEYSEEMANQSHLEKNLKMIGYLLHEIEHLKEESKKSQKTFEGRVLKCGCSEYVCQKIYNAISNKGYSSKKIDIIVDAKYKKFCEKNWEFMPSERIAESCARKNILESLISHPEYESKFFNEYRNLMNYYIRSLKMGYVNKGFSFHEAPIFNFFISIKGDSDLIKLLTLAPDISSQEKMMYGFPIEPQDVIEINKMKVKTRR